MKTYELTYIISSGVNQGESDNLIKEVESLIQSKNGLMLKSDKTTPQMFSYPIQKQSSGYFVALDFQMEENKIKELKENLEKNKNILRQLIIKKPIRAFKERRVRRPFFTDKKPTERFSLTDNKKTSTEKTESIDIDKKLDEILGE